MPIYEYECRACGQRHEVVQAISDPPLVACASCQGEIYRVISAPGLSFKGEGWYITDYARKGKEAPKADTKSDKKESSAPAPATAEKKTEPTKTAESKPSSPSTPSDKK